MTKRKKDDVRVISKDYSAYLLDPSRVKKYDFRVISKDYPFTRMTPERSGIRLKEAMKHVPLGWNVIHTSVATLYDPQTNYESGNIHVEITIVPKEAVYDA